MSIELTIVATRRPELLRATLQSFNEKMFKNFSFSRVSMNVDKLWGDEEDERNCIEVLKSFYPQAIVYAPPVPGFAAAVKRLWLNSEADFVFHMEDDWELLEEIPAGILDLFGEKSVSQVSLMTKEKNWSVERRGMFHYARKSYRFLGFDLPIRLKYPNFTTSPAFLRGDFARGWGKLLDETLDPEKQVRSLRNPQLMQYVSKFRNRLYVGKSGYYVAEDTGRVWRDRMGIEKVVVDDASAWLSK
ncbi:hypothetical protein EV132_104252 [Rhizobium sullae]|uniref:Glycosyl transferase family 2 n=2 Tax=Rhizobium sullae TaxID=50338 RepID=A0A4R3Q9J9_RHISU|nr:hypothetical protein EV132_104252 [Rhizobium sullae]